MSFQLASADCIEKVFPSSPLIGPFYFLTVIASPSGPLRPSDWVILNCSFSRPDRPVSVHWFQGQSRVPVHKSTHHHLAESFLFLPQVSPLDSGTWGCVLTYRDGFNVSITHNLEVLGNSPPKLSLLLTPFCPSPFLTHRPPQQVLSCRVPSDCHVAVCKPFPLWESFF